VPWVFFVIITRNYQGSGETKLFPECGARLKAHCGVMETYLRCGKRKGCHLHDTAALKGGYFLFLLT